MFRNKEFRKVPEGFRKHLRKQTCSTNIDRLILASFVKICCSSLYLCTPHIYIYIYMPLHITLTRIPQRRGPLQNRNRNSRTGTGRLQQTGRFSEGFRKLPASKHARPLRVAKLVYRGREPRSHHAASKHCKNICKAHKGKF